MSFYVNLFILFVIIVIIMYWYKKDKERRALIDSIPGPPYWPFVGNILDILSTPGELWIYVRRFNKLYYPIYRIWSGRIPSINLLIPEDIEMVLASTKHIKKSKVYECLQPWLGTGLLTSSGKKWRSRRKILTPAFHFNILRHFVDVFSEQSDLLIMELKNECDKPHTNVVPFITKFTLNSICETAMGTRLDQSQIEQNDYIKAIYRLGELIVHRIVRPWLFSNFIYNLTRKSKEEKLMAKVLHDFSRSVIEERKINFVNIDLAETEQENFVYKNRLAMLDLLISAQNSGEDIDDDGIQEEVDTFMFEGHDTTATSICFTLMLLASHPEIQEKVLQEVKSVNSTCFTYQDLQKMNYLERVLKESLRMYPSVPFIARVTSDEIHTFTGYTIPKNCYVHIHIFDLHYNPEIYPNPHKFDPDRFLPEKIKERHPFAYLPFSAGPRNCIGQKFALLELKTIIAKIVLNYSLHPVDAPENLNLICDLVLRASEGIRVKFSQRSDT